TSPEVATEIDRQVKLLLDNARSMAIAILRLNRGLLESATQTLLETEVLDGEQLQAMLAQAQAPTELQSWLAGGYSVV
ncbi:MAG TPA: hypothetical protein VEZ50_10090, partial [Nodosilinea sp.]|nr:hypothetical protein [Nodosilinea sp.]